MSRCADSAEHPAKPHRTDSSAAIVTPLHSRRNALLSLAVFLVALLLVYSPTALDFPLTHLVNRYADQSRVLDRVLHAFDVYFTFSGVVLMAIIWACWFGTENLATRASILVGTIASFLAGTVSRTLQYRLLSHPRPLYDPALGFHLPSIFHARMLNTWNSFPSDHVAVFAGLTTVVFLAHSRLRWLALAWIVLVEFSRVYAGAHYPSDLLGGAALAGFIVWITQIPSLLAVGRQIAARAQIRPQPFYLAAFFLSYQIATLFTDLRGFATFTG